MATLIVRGLMLMEKNGKVRVLVLMIARAGDE